MRPAGLGNPAVTSAVEGTDTMPDNEVGTATDAVGGDVEVDPDNQADVAEEFAESAGIDPTPHEVQEYLALQDDPDALQDEPPAVREDPDALEGRDALEDSGPGR